jgi:Fur family ferric uptake transcriptional regulator
MTEETLLKKILRDSGYSLTKVRSLIFTLLRDAAEPQTMHQLIETSNASADRVSVYRTVELYEKLGIAQRINIGWKYKIELSDVFLGHHHHMTCLNCGRVIAIKGEQALEDMMDRIGKSNGFTLQNHQLEIQGYCNMCQHNEH